MSDAISAFAAYKAKPRAGAGKANKKTNAKKNNSTAKGKGKAKANGGKAAASTSKKNKLSANTSTPHITVASTKKQANGGAKSTKSIFSPDNVLDERLLTGNKVDKTDLKKQRELEKYFIEQLEADDANKETSGSEDGSEYESYTDSDSYTSESDGSTGTDTFSTEYTINTTKSDDTSKTEDTSTTDDTGAEDKEQTFSLHLLKKFENGGATKRKTKGETATAKGKVNADVVPKKMKQEVNVRKSLPAQKSNPQVVVQRGTKDTSLQNGILLKEEPTSTTKAKLPIKIEPLAPVKDVVHMNSIEEGKKLFAWLLQPISVKTFFENYWEKAPVCVQRQSDYFNKLISFDMIDQMLRDNHIEYTKNIDITSYKNGKRETHNLEERALPPYVWGRYDEGCSIRLLNPQTYLTELCQLNTTLQEFFGCMVGANVYLTPPNSQGFAPHYDDIEAFILQVEGTKRWKLYKPRNAAETLPRYSSPNFSQEEIGKPFLEIVLQPGDLLYFPRGVIHQACTEKESHSLHITLSVYQKQSYADLFEHMLPLLLKRFIAQSVDIRRGVPLDVWQNAGAIYNKDNTKERTDFQKKVKQLLNSCLRDTPLVDVIDDAVDQMAKKFQHEALPPYIKPIERLHTVYGLRTRIGANGHALSNYDIGMNTKIRLLRANIIRLVKEENAVRIFFRMDNSKEYCERDLMSMEIEPTEAFSVEVLIKTYPNYMAVSQLPMPEENDRIQIAVILWEHGFLMLEKPLK